MTTQPHRPPPPAAALRPRGVHLLHLAVLASLAFGQQLLDLLARTPEFLVIRGLGNSEVVLLALLVGLLPGALLATLVGGLRLAAPRLAWPAQLVVLSGLVTLVLLQALKQAAWDRAWPLAFVAGAAAAWFYHRMRPLRQFLTLLSPALFVIPLLFLLSGDVRRVTTGAPGADVELGASGASAPIVFVVFDEWSLVSVLDAEGDLDRERLPHLATFSDGATWFRGATATSDVTELALPAILTGRIPAPDSLPSANDHPRNLFTLFADYHIDAREPITRLCPQGLGCRPQEASTAAEPAAGLVTDLAVVWLHLVVPAPHDARLPTISQSWRGFLGAGASATGDGEPDRNDFVTLARHALVTRSRDEDFRDFVAAIGAEGAAEKTLHFGHFLLPHVPLEYLPSGRRYLTQASHLPGIYKEKWQEDPWLPVQAFHRYLLQVEYLDRLLGEMFAVLRERGLFDDSLVVLMADHGASFRPGQSRRVYAPENAADIAPIPLFVKAPGQTEGRVVDEPVSAVDVLPTILDLLDVEPPAELDGVSFAGDEPPGERTLPLVTKYSGRFDVTPATRLEWGAEGLEHAQWQQKIYDGRASLPSLELHRDLLGRPTAELPTTHPDTTRRVRIDGASLYAGYDPSGPLSLAWVTGAIDGVPCCPTVAVAVGGRIAATTRAYEQPGSGIRFGALLPEEALEKGAHDLEVLEIGRIGGARALVLLGRPDAQRYRLELGPDGAIRAVVGDGDRLSLDGKIDGYLQRVRVAGDTVSVGGWTVDLEAVDLVEEVLLFYRGELVSRGVTSLPRENVVRSLGNDAYFNSGFDFVIPRSLAPDVPRHGIRVVAVARSGGAGELGIFYDRIVAGQEGEIVTVTDGREIPLGSPAMDGRIEHVEERDGKLWLVGWAADVEAGAPAERVIVFRDGRYSTQFRPGGERAEIAQRFDDPRLLRCGINVPTAPDTRQLLRNGRMRVVAISQAGEALELVEGGRRAPTAGAGRETGR